MGQFFLGFFFKSSGVCIGLAFSSCTGGFVSHPGRFGFLFRPCVPARAIARHVFQRDTVYRARRNTQLATRAIAFYDGVHALVATDDAIYRARLDAQRAAYAPCFVDPGHASRNFRAMCRIEGEGIKSGDASQALNAFRATGWALVDKRLPSFDGSSVASAVWITAPRTLRLRQSFQ